MRLAKKIPFVILILMLISAVAVLGVGIHLARESRVVEVKQDKSPLTNFMARVIDEIRDTEALYESHLLSIARDIDGSSSAVKVGSLCKIIVGIEQATVFRKGSRAFSIDLREAPKGTPLPTPNALGDSDTLRKNGLVVNLDQVDRDDFAPRFVWVKRPGHPLHFMARADNDTVVVFRINEAETAVAFDEMIDYELENFIAPILAAGIACELRGPREAASVSSNHAELKLSSAAFLLPIPTLFGEWKLASWPKTETIVTYRQPVLISAAALALLLAIAGIFGFTYQQRAVKLAEQRVSFVNRVSHELRTPLTNILLNIDLVSDSLSESPGAKSATRRLGLIRDESSRLSRLLENVLTFSQRDKSNAPRITLCNPAEIIRDVVAQFSASLNRKNLIANIGEPSAQLHALADPDALSQIMSNLISNVEKYAPDTHEFSIDISESKKDSRVLISVIDQGGGISKENIARIFQPFTRLNEATTEGVSGTGLGLSIARDLAEKMNGSLKLIPQQSGAHFQLTLPIAASPEASNVIPLSIAS